MRYDYEHPVPDPEKAWRLLKAKMAASTNREVARLASYAMRHPCTCGRCLYCAALTEARFRQLASGRAIVHERQRAVQERPA